MNKVFKALSDPTRRRVLEILRSGPATAGELASHFPFSRPTMSQHFNILKDAGLMEATKVGKTVVYRLKASVLEEALLTFAGAVGLEMKSASSAKVETPGSARQGPRKAR